jgi:hypothetical protein
MADCCIATSAIRNNLYHPIILACKDKTFFCQTGRYR